MPGFNGMGPSGQGPMTGHGRGYCIMPLEDYKKQLAKRSISGFCGFGRGWRNMYFATGLPGWARGKRNSCAFGMGTQINPDVYAKNDFDLLKQEFELLKTRLDSLQEQISKTEKTE